MIQFTELWYLMLQGYDKHRVFLQRALGDAGKWECAARTHLQGTGKGYIMGGHAWTPRRQGSDWVFLVSHSEWAKGIAVAAGWEQAIAGAVVEALGSCLQTQVAHVAPCMSTQVQGMLLG